MKNKTFLIILVVLISVLSGCGLFQNDVTVTVNYTGVDVGGPDVDIYLAIALGSYSFSPTTPTATDIVQQIEIAHSETLQTALFTVPAKENYTVFIYFDANDNQAYDAGETVNSDPSGSLAYIEDNATVTITYNF